MSHTGSRRVAFHLFVFLTAAAIVVSRRPDALSDPQFFAEDGAVWFPDAYNFGFRCLVLTHGGYLHTLTRLVALLSVLFPFTAAPLVMNLCALFVQVLPANLLHHRNRESRILLQVRMRIVARRIAAPGASSSSIDSQDRSVLRQVR